jgi:hypothetical protein
VTLMAASKKLLDRVPAGLPRCADDEHLHEILLSLSLSCYRHCPVGPGVSHSMRTTLTVTGLANGPF